MNTATQWTESSDSRALVEEDVVRFYPAVLEFFRRRLSGGRRADAEDLAQDTVVGAWIAFRRDRASIEHPAAFVLKIARYKLYSYIRSARRHPEESLEDHDTNAIAARVREAAAETKLIERDLVDQIRRVLGRLPQLEHVMTEGTLRGIAHDELCRAIGVDPAEGSRVKWRAINRLRFEMRVPRARAGSRSAVTGR